MEAYYILITLYLAAIQGSPLPKEATAAVEAQKDGELSPGFLIPMDTWNSLQNQLQPKTNQPFPNSNNLGQNVIILPNQPLFENPTDTINFQINGNGNNSPNTNNPIILTPLPGTSNPQMVLQPGQFLMSHDPKTGQMTLTSSGTIQGSQPQLDNPIIFMQQPAQNNPIVVPQQPGQPLYVQPGQNYVIQNGQEGIPTQVMVAIPSNNQGGYINAQASQNQGPVYAYVMSGQNPNPSQNGNIYLVQSGSSNPIVLRPAK